MVRGNFRDQLKKHGHDRGDTRKHDRGKPRYRESLPDDYLSKGYFDEDGCLREELVTSVAQEVAQSFLPKLKSSQLRRFYGHIKKAENRLSYTDDWACVNTEVKKLIPFAHDAAASPKPKVPQTFLEFIKRNLSLVSKENEKAFTKGFVPHFEAVVAFHKYFGKD